MCACLREYVVRYMMTVANVCVCVFEGIRCEGHDDSNYPDINGRILFKQNSLAGHQGST